LASAEFAKSLTLKAVTVLTEAVAVVGCTFGKISAYDFGDVSTMGLYWICMIRVSYFISNIFLEGSYSVRRLFSVKTKTDDESCTESSTRTQYLQVVKNTVSTITGREGFEEEKSSVDFDNELLPRD
jgi:hypothetical protein